MLRKGEHWIHLKRRIEKKDVSYLIELQLTLARTFGQSMYENDNSALALTLLHVRNSQYVHRIIHCLPLQLFIAMEGARVQTAACTRCGPELYWECRSMRMSKHMAMGCL